MSVKVYNNYAKVTFKVTNASSLGLRLLLDEIYRIALPNTPKEFGLLGRGVLRSVVGLKGRMRWAANYAIYQENNQFKNYTTPGTGPHFAENAVNEGIKKSQAIFNKVK